VLSLTIQGAAEQERELSSLLEFMPGASIWTLLAFGLALWPMWKMVFGPITRALATRDQKVEDAIQAAEGARTKAEQQMTAAKAELDQARTEARRMVDEAVGRAERQAAEAARAADERQKIEVQKAREAIAAEKRAALQEIRAVVVELTIAATSRLIQQQVDDPTQRRMVQEFVADAAKEAR